MLSYVLKGYGKINGNVTEHEASSFIRFRTIKRKRVFLQRCITGQCCQLIALKGQLIRDPEPFPRSLLGFLDGEKSYARSVKENGKKGDVVAKRSLVFMKVTGSQDIPSKQTITYPRKWKESDNRGNIFLGFKVFQENVSRRTNKKFLRS